MGLKTPEDFESIGEFLMDGLLLFFGVSVFPTSSSK